MQVDRVLNLGRTAELSLGDCARAFISVCVCARVRACVHVCVCVHAFTAMHVHMHIHACRHVHTHACAHLCMPAHTHTHTHTHTHARTHLDVQPWAASASAWLITAGTCIQWNPSCLFTLMMADAPITCQSSLIPFHSHIWMISSPYFHLSNASTLYSIQLNNTVKPVLNDSL